MKRYALSFYGSKKSPNHFGQVPIILIGSNSFWSGPNHYGQIQIIKISLEKSTFEPDKKNVALTKTIWNQPKQFAPVENNLDSPK